MITQLDRKVRTYTLLNQVGMPRVLMLQDGTGWSLPTISPLGGRIADINQAMYDEYEVLTTYLRRIAYHRQSEEKWIETIEGLENQSPTWQLPPRCKWVDRVALNDLILTIPDHRAIIENWIKELEIGFPSHLAPWQRPGWLPKPLKWASRHLTPLGIILTGSFRQLAVSPAHFLLEVDTTGGRFYIKGVAGRLANEQALTCVLAKWESAYLPEVIAADNTRHWWLMRDAGGQHLDKLTDVKYWEKALRDFAKLQINCAERVQELLLLGCPDYRLPALVGQIDWFFTVAAELKAAYSCGINDDIADFCALASRLKDLCARLADYGLPPSIGHGDLNTGNIIITDGRCIYIDWAMGYVGHPLFSAAGFPEYAAHIQSELKSASGKLRQAYLEPWSAFLKIDDLQKAYQISRPLELLRYAIEGTRIITDTKAPPEDNGPEAVVYLYNLIRRLSKIAYSAKIGD